MLYCSLSSSVDLLAHCAELLRQLTLQSREHIVTHVHQVAVVIFITASCICCGGSSRNLRQLARACRHTRLKHPAVEFRLRL